MKMIKTCLLWVGLFCMHVAQLNAQNFSPPSSIPTTLLSDTTRLTLLNSRLGSRFSCSFSSADLGIHTGLHGFDADEFNELLLMVEIPEGKFAFKTSSLPKGASYLQNQEMRFGMTTMQLTGNTPSGTSVVFTLVSPFTPSQSLSDTARLKAQIAPVFLFLVEIQPASGQSLEGEYFIGFKKLPYNRQRESNTPSFRYGRPTTTLYFKDAGLSHEEGLLALASWENETIHFKEGPFQGLKQPFNTKAGQAARLKLIYAGHHSGKVQYDKRLNLPLSFYYTLFWKDIDEVISYARAQGETLLKWAAKFEEILENSSSGPEEKWVIALAFHTDLANTFLLTDKHGEARFYVLEGRFLHQSTIDVAHETELNAVFAPWRLKLQLHQWLDYVARQEVVLGYKQTKSGIEAVKEGMSASEYGPFLYHDVGNYPYIAAQSEYDYGPHMAVEENATYVLLLYWYWKMTADDSFVRDKLGMVDVLLHSLTNRDTDDSGIADMGIGWSTYDVSEAIKRSPENVYLGVKQFCAYLAAAEMFKSLKITGTLAKKEGEASLDNVLDGEGAGFAYEALLPNAKLREKQAARYEAEAMKIEKTLAKAYKKYGFIPVSLDETFEGWNQKSVVLGEGLFLMGLAGAQHPALTRMAKPLRDTYQQALKESTTSYGIKLSSGEGVTWFSKVMVADIVASYWYGIDNSTAVYTYQWNKNNPNAYNDGAYHATLDWIGYWYPRGISSLGYLFRGQKWQGKQIFKQLNQDLR